MSEHAEPVKAIQINLDEAHKLNWIGVREIVLLNRSAKRCDFDISQETALETINNFRMTELC